MNSISNIQNEFGDIKEISTIDGVRLQLDDGWVLLRPSGTEPIIRITVEAQNNKRVNNLLEASKKFVNKIIGD